MKLLRKYEQGALLPWWRCVAWWSERYHMYITAPLGLGLLLRLGRAAWVLLKHPFPRLGLLDREAALRAEIEYWRRCYERATRGDCDLPENTGR